MLWCSQIWYIIPTHSAIRSGAWAKRREQTRVIKWCCSSSYIYLYCGVSLFVGVLIECLSERANLSVKIACSYMNACHSQLLSQLSQLSQLFLLLLVNWFMCSICLLSMFWFVYLVLLLVLMICLLYQVGCVGSSFYFVALFIHSLFDPDWH